MFFWITNISDVLQYNFPTGDICERIRKERQRERDLRHSQRMVQENREMNHHGGVHHSPAINGNREHFSGTGSEGSDDSLHIGNGTTRKYVTHTKSTKHRIVRRSDSEDDGSKDGSTERLQILPAASFNNSDNVIRSKGVVFLQCADDVKRVNLPATVTSIDTLKALFVTSFPDRITMQDFEDGMKSVYIKDADTGTYYMLEDVGEVLNRSFLKIHEKSPSIISGSSQTLLTNVESQEVTTTPKNAVVRNSASEYTQPLDASPRVPVVNGGSSVIKTATYTHSTHNHVPNGNAHHDPPSDTTHVHIRGVYSQQQSPKRHTQERTDKVDGKYNATVHDVLRTPVAKTRTESYTSSTSKTDSVEDQLDDLTELLKTALDEEEQHHAEIMECVNTKNPGKLDPSLLEKIQHETQTLARKSTLPKYFHPTVMVAAQQESDRRTSERSNSESESASPKTSTLRAKFENAEINNKITTSTDLDNNNNKSNTNPIIDRNVIEREDVDIATEDSVSPPSKRHVNYVNIDSNDTVDGIVVNDVSTKTEQVKVDSQSESAVNTSLSSVPSEYSTAKMSDVLMDQIMDMELEVKARSNKTLRNSQRSSTGSSCSKSSIPCSSEKLNTSIEDHPKLETSPLAQPPPIETNHTSMHDTSTATVIEENTIDDTYSTVHKNKPTTNGLDDQVFNETADDNTVSNGPTNMQHIYASISKVTNLPTSSKVTTTFGNTTKTDVKRSVSARKSTGEAACHHASVTTPDFIELEDSAKSVHTSLQQLRKDLSSLRKSHVDGVKMFKADIQKKLLEFRKKAARVDEVLQQKLDVNNNIIFANEHPVRERRHRLTDDQLSYNKKMGDTEYRLRSLEGDMERIRLSVVNKKRVENPQDLKNLHEELTQLTKGLAEIKNRFHGLHDMLKIVMPDEMKIISQEERFLKEEPQKLEGLIGRCKVLSGTLFTLERLASVQLEQGENLPSPQSQHSTRSNSESMVTTSRSSEHHTYTKQTSSTKTAASHTFKQPVANNAVFDIEDLKGKRNVRFSHKN